MKIKQILTATLLFSVFHFNSNAQNVGVNTDGSTPETGVMLDVKSTTPKATTAAVQTVFQVKSSDANTDALKLRIGFKTDATPANRYGFMDFPDYASGTPTYRDIVLQPSGGNVGIGISAPLEKLHVLGNTRISTLAGTGTRMVQADANGTLIPLAAGTSSQVLLGTGAWGSIPASSGNYIQNQIAAAQATSNFWISATGRANQLVIDGTSNAAGNLQFTAANPYITASSYIIMPGGLYVSGGTLYATNQIEARGGIHNDVGAYLAIAGGTSGFTSFAGGIGVNGVTSSTYMMEVNGKIKSTSVNESSDIRWKKDISTIENALATVKELRGVNYKWRADEFKNKAFDLTPQIGLIAQEVEKILPQIVGTDQDGFKSVEYSKLVAVLIEAIKEQQKQFEAQQNKIDELQKTVAELVKASPVGASAEKKDK